MVFTQVIYLFINRHMMDLELAERRLGKLKDGKLGRQKIRAENMKNSGVKDKKSKKEKKGATGAAEKFHSMVPKSNSAMKTDLD